MTAIVSIVRLDTTKSQIEERSANDHIKYKCKQTVK